MDGNFFTLQTLNLVKILRTTQQNFPLHSKRFPSIVDKDFSCEIFKNGQKKDVASSQTGSTNIFSFLIESLAFLLPMVH